MVSYMGPYIMSAEVKTRVIRLAAANGIFPDKLVTQLIEVGLEVMDPDCSITSRPDIDLTEPRIRTSATGL